MRYMFASSTCLLAFGIYSLSVTCVCLLLVLSVRVFGNVGCQSSILIEKRYGSIELSYHVPMKQLNTLH